MNLATVANQTEAGFWLALKYSPYWGTCLSRSILMKTLLHRQNVPTILRIGVSKASGDFQAHAWLELENRVIRFDRGLCNQFTPLEPWTGAVEIQPRAETE